MRPLETSVTRKLPFAGDPALRRRFAVVKEEIPANLRWGLLLEVIDDLAGETAIGHARRTDPDARVVTAAIDDIVLRTPARLDRDIDLYARINHVGRTSMEVGIRIAQEGLSLASCYFTMVARSGGGPDATSLPVEPLEYVDEMERVRRDLAIERRATYREQEVEANAPPTPAEFALLTSLHRAQDEPGFSGRLAGDLVRSSWERMYPEYENVPETIFGGYLIRRAFEHALMHAGDLVSHRPAVVRVNRVNFLEAVRIGDELRFTSRITYTGRTSLAVELDIERTSRDRGVRSVSNSCVFTFVNVDEEMRPQPVPAVFPTTYAEDARYLAGHRRHVRHPGYAPDQAGRAA